MMTTPINPALTVQNFENTVHIFFQVEREMFSIVSLSRRFIIEIPWFKVNWPMIPPASVLKTIAFSRETLYDRVVCVSSIEYIPLFER